MSFFRRFFSKEVCTADAYPSPPSSTSTSSWRKRRTEGSSESDGEPFLGDTSIHNQDYRCGGPVLVELPAISQIPHTHNPVNTKWEDELKTPVMEILNKHNIDYNGVYPVQRASEAAIHKDWQDTLLVSATKHALDDAWYKACKEIQTFLIAKDTPFNIEMIDERASIYPRAYAIDFQDPFVAQWPSLRDAIIDTLGDSDWTVLQPLLLGSPDGLGPRTITVSLMVRFESTCIWTSIRERIIKILDNQGLYHVAVAIHRGSVLQTLLEPRLLEKRDWKLPTVFGGSIGLRGSDDSSGTFGGYLELQSTDGTWQKYGITNYHCIRNGLSYHEYCDQHGVNPDDAQNNPILVDQPSLKCHKRTVKEYLSNIKEAENVVSAEIQQQIQAGDPSVPMGKIRLYEKNQKVIEATSTLIDQGTRFIQEKHHHLGRVYAASGFRATDRLHLLDWALIEVRKERLGKNEIPQISDPTMPTKVKTLYDPDEKYISGTAALTDEMTLFKKGNRTGFTAGQLTGTKEATLQHWIKNKEGKWTKVMGRAYSVAPRSNSAFGDAGDSGSLVIDEFGKLAGLYLGGHRNIGWGLFIGWEDLFADIQLMTGAKKVRVPST
ncbi:hypothetical protein MauCBS54593_002967 [Microsporum audouinii]